MATVKVRIAVAVGADGTWNACGWKASELVDDGEMMGIAIDGVDQDSFGCYYLTAELEIPQEREVAANVEAAQP